MRRVIAVVVVMVGSLLVPGAVLTQPATGAAVGAAGDRPAPARSYPLPDSGGPTAPRSAATGLLVAQRATLTAADRPSGYSANPAYAMTRADVQVEVLGNPPSYYGVEGTVTLASASRPGDTYVQLGFGNSSGNTCAVTSSFTEHVSADDDRVVEFDSYASDLPRPWDCVVALTGPDYQSAPGTAYDVLIGVLTSTYQSPRFAVGKVSLLDKAQKRLKLVRGVPTEVSVVVRNTGPVLARGVVVTGKGKKVKTTKGVIDAIRPGESGTAVIKVKVKGAKPGKLKVRASSAGVQATRKLKVKRIKPPARPRAGTYRNKAGTVTFAIRKGKVVGWRGHMQTRCGGYPSLPTYTMNTYDFPKVKIPRNGIVQAKKRGRNYGTRLQLKAVGAKVTHGRFNYSGPARCAAVITFKAKRVGR